MLRDDDALGMLLLGFAVAALLALYYGIAALFGWR